MSGPTWRSEESFDIWHEHTKFGIFFNLFLFLLLSSVSTLCSLHSFQNTNVYLMPLYVENMWSIFPVYFFKGIQLRDCRNLRRDFGLCTVEQVWDGKRLGKILRLDWMHFCTMACLQVYRSRERNMVVWIKSTPIYSSVWKLGPWEVALLGGLDEIGMTFLEEVCHFGQDLRSQMLKCGQSVTVPCCCLGIQMLWSYPVCYDASDRYNNWINFQNN